MEKLLLLLSFSNVSNLYSFKGGFADYICRYILVANISLKVSCVRRYSNK